MEIRCKHCGEYFNPGDETIELIAEGFIFSASVNICDDCWDLIEYQTHDISELYSDADPGL